MVYSTSACNKNFILISFFTAFLTLCSCFVHKNLITPGDGHDSPQIRPPGRNSLLQNRSTRHDSSVGKTALQRAGKFLGGWWVH